MDILSERERIILQSIVGTHIATAEPVGSRTISRRFGLGLSSATIRNSMFDLEEKGYVRQPHTSAGRVPTDKGYRCYVDHLMAEAELTDAERKAILEHVRARIREGDAEDILEQIVRVIAEVSKQLGVALSPRFENGVLRRLEMVSLTEKRVLLALTIRSGLVKTMVMEIEAEVASQDLVETTRVLNERLSGLTLGEIKRSIRERVADATRGDPKLLRLIADEADELFRFDAPEGLHVGGTTNILAQPEFSDREKLLRLMGLLEAREPLVYLLSQRIGSQGVAITIGCENPTEEMQMCSLVTASYTVGEVSGVIGLLGPTRMPYPRLRTIVAYTAELTRELLNYEL